MQFNKSILKILVQDKGGSGTSEKVAVCSECFKVTNDSYLLSSETGCPVSFSGDRNGSAMRPCETLQYFLTTAKFSQSEGLGFCRKSVNDSAMFLDRVRLYQQF